MFKKKKTYVILFLIIVIIGGIFYLKNKKPVVEYTTQKAEKGDLIRTVSVTGVVSPPQEVALSFGVAGQISSMNVEVGDKVKKSQVIATVDTGVLYEQLYQAEREVEVQEETLADMRKRDDTYNGYQRDAQRERIKKAKAAVDEIRRKIKDTVIYAPIEGIIIEKEVEKGEMVAATETIVTIAEEGDLDIEVNIPESDITDVSLGQKASVSLDALPSNETLEAVVTEIEPASTVIQEVVYYKAKFKFANQDERLKIGMSADVDINTAEKDGVVMIPLRAVKNDDQGDYVEILKADNAVERVNVKTGLKGDDSMMEIVSGLNGGEDVIILSSEK